MAFSSTAKSAMYSQETGEVIVTLITITKPGVGVIGRVSSDPTVRLADDPLLYATPSRGNWYYFIPFQFILPNADQGQAPTAKLMFDNIDRNLITEIRSVHTPALLTFELVLVSSLDTVEMSLIDLQVQHCQYDAQQVIITLGYQSLMDEPFPAISFTPNYATGLFR